MSSTRNRTEIQKIRDICILGIALIVVINVTSFIDPGTLISLGIGFLTGAIVYAVMKKRGIFPKIR